MPRRLAVTLALAAALLVVAAGIGVAVILVDRDGGEAPSLPPAARYHALLVDPGDAQRLLLATDRGLYASEDGGATWRPAGLDGSEATHLARTRDGTFWAGGPSVLARSDDRGATWTVLTRPRGLPNGELTALAGDLTVGRLYVVVAGGRLFAAGDGEPFAPLAVAGTELVELALTADGVLWSVAAGGELLVDPSGEGGDWVRRPPEPRVTRLAVSPADPDRLLAAGAGGIFLTANDGVSWETVLELDLGGAAVAWAGDGETAYAAGRDGRLYRSADGGAGWRPAG